MNLRLPLLVGDPSRGLRRPSGDTSARSNRHRLFILWSFICDLYSVVSHALLNIYWRRTPYSLDGSIGFRIVSFMPAALLLAESPS